MSIEGKAAGEGSASKRFMTSATAFSSSMIFIPVLVSIGQKKIPTLPTKQDHSFAGPKAKSQHSHLENLNTGYS